jgi:hypothetical protein
MNNETKFCLVCGSNGDIECPAEPACTWEHQFELNGKRYATDEATIHVLRGIVPSAKATGDSSAVIAVMELGLHTRRIVLIA